MLRVSDEMEKALGEQFTFTHYFGKSHLGGYFDSGGILSRFE